MKVVILSILITIVFYANLSTQQQPGFSTYIQEQSLNYMAAQAVPLVVAKVLSLSLPDVDQEVHTPIGRVDFKLYNMHITQFSINSINLKIVQGVGFQVAVSNIYFAASSDWHYKEKSFPHVSDHGSMDMHTTIDVTMLVHVSADASGHLVISIDPNINVNVQDLSLHLHGGASWLYNLIKSTFEHSIKKSVENTIRDQITGTLNNRLQEAVAKIDYQHRIGEQQAQVYIDLTMLQVVFNSTQPAYFSLGSKGMFYQQGGAPYPGPAAPYIPYQTVSSAPSMIQIFVTDYLINSLAWAWYQSGCLQKTITDQDLPSQVPIRLNTKFFAIIAPGLLTKFPDTPMQIEINLSGKDFQTAPVCTITPDGATVVANGATVFQVVQNGTVYEAFTLNVILNFQFKINVQGNLVVGSMQLNKMDLTLRDSQVGDVAVGMLNTILNPVVQFVLVPIINDQLSAGFPIPTVPGLNLNNPQIVFKDRFIGVASNFTFTPSHL